MPCFFSCILGKVIRFSCSIKVLLTKTWSESCRPLRTIILLILMPLNWNHLDMGLWAINRENVLKPDHVRSSRTRSNLLYCSQYLNDGAKFQDLNPFCKFFYYSRHPEVGSACFGSLGITAKNCRFPPNFFIPGFNRVLQGKCMF